MQIANKVVLITGSNTGIGAEAAKLFAHEKAIVIITYFTNRRSALLLAQDCLDLGAKDCDVFHLDVTSHESIHNCVKKVIDKYKKIDILINNAGVIVWKDFMEQTEKEITNQIAVNLEGLIKMTKEVLKYMLPRKNGIVINIASGAGKRPHAILSTYCATKFGVRGFTQTLALEFKGKGIRFYCVNPDRTATSMTGFEGRPPSQVARVILNTAKENVYKVSSGADIDVWEVA